jgi:hypothetical protein
MYEFLDSYLCGTLYHVPYNPYVCYFCKDLAYVLKQVTVTLLSSLLESDCHLMDIQKITKRPREARKQGVRAYARTPCFRKSFQLS